MTTSDLDQVDQLIEAGDFDGARSALTSVPQDLVEGKVLRAKLGLYDGTLPPGPAMQRLIQIMRQHPDAPRVKELYQEASNRAYQSRQSSVSHSHPPPPSEDGTEGSK
ncbi:MAG TPA: hypothetical protein PKA88_01365 [Polyangiaceae bacterium]|nr:hypothetical protein [Polyangiaceae bacterium]HMR75594.1 hypothetical protein [Polyangiaceae bacterium]